MLGLGLGAYLPYVFYLVIFLSALLSIAWRPTIGVYTLMAILPLHTGRSRLATLPLGTYAVEVLILAVAVGILLHRGSLLPRVPFRRLILGIVAVMYLSMWGGSLLASLPVPITPADTRFINWILYLRMPVIFLLVFATITDTRKMRIMLLCMLLSFVWVNRGFYNTMSGRDTAAYSHNLRQGVELGWAGANGFAAFQAQCTLFLLGMYGAEKSKKIKLAMAVGIAVGALGLLFSYSRGGYVGFVLGLLYLGIFRIRILLPALALLALSWQTVLPKSVQQRILMSYQDAELDPSAESRLGLWKEALNLTLHNPLTGIGFDTFRFYRAGEELQDTHNMYLKALVETGVVGLALLVVLFGRAFWFGHTLFRSTADPFLKAVGLGFAAYMVGVVAVNLFGDRWTYLEVSGFTWALLGMVVRARMLAAAPAPSGTQVGVVPAEPVAAWRSA